MKLLLFLLFFTSLFAKKEDTCYTVQLFSAPLSQKENVIKKLDNYPNECQLMEISKTLTMRCGCFEHVKDANQKLDQLKERYHQASLAVSYRYRFKNTQTPQYYSNKEKNSMFDYHDNELHLILQAFLYSQDLTHALQTAQIGIHEYPHSLYWNQKMAEILRWMGRAKEAFPYMEYLYYRTKEQKLSKEIIDYALSSYQYENVKKLVTETYLNEPNKVNKKRLLFIYNQIGIADQAAKLLEQVYKRTNNKQLLTDTLQLYINLEDLENAKKIIDIMEKENYYTSKNIELISYYYYVNRDIKNAFAILNKYDLDTKYNQHLNELLSDLGWYLQRYNEAAKASLRLLKHDNARLVDYERLIYVHKTKKAQEAMHYALAAFKKYKLPYLFYSFANIALKEKQYTLLEKTFKEIESTQSALLKQVDYYILKARLYALSHQKEKAFSALQQACSLTNKTISAQLQIIDLYLQLGDNQKVKTLLNNITNDPRLPSAYLLPIAALYFTIHDVNQASFYLQKLKEQHSDLTQSKDFLFLEDDIYKAQFNNNAHMQTLRTLRKNMQKELRDNPDLKNSDKFLYDWLRVSLHLDDIDTFSKELKEAKNKLTKAHYNDLSYSLAVKIGATDMAHNVYLHTQNSPLWLDFADALLEEDHTKKEDLLFYHLHKIPRDDASYGAHQIGEIALAQTLAFDSLEENEKNKNAYISMLNYTKERSDMFEVKTSYFNQDPLLRKYITLNNAFYVADGLYIFAHLNYYKNSSLDKDVLIYVPSSSTEIYGGFKQLFDEGEIDVSIGKSNSMANYYTADIKGRYKLNNYFSFQAEIAKNITANESIQLRLGGMKNMLSTTLIYNILNSTSLEVRVNKNRYNSQDNIYIGDGTYIQALLGHQLRNGYPDMRMIFSADYGSYSESSGDKGVVEQLRNKYDKVLPNDFCNLGVVFDYGMQNSTIYTRVWRPFFEVSSYYNSEISGLTYGFYAGYGGKVYLQDHLITGIKYTSDVSGVGGSVLELFLTYQFLYTH